VETKSPSRRYIVIVVVVIGALLALVPFLMKGKEPAAPAPRTVVRAATRPAAKLAPILSLHDAAKLGNMTPIVQQLRAGQDVNALDSLGRTPLHLAVENGHQKTSELLLANGADIAARNSAGETPLHIAAASGHKDLAAMLIARGADIAALDNAGKTPLQLAVQNRHDEMAAFLRSMSQAATTQASHI